MSTDHTSTVDDLAGVLESDLTRNILGQYDVQKHSGEGSIPWSRHVSERITRHLKETVDQLKVSEELVGIGRACLQGFLQANVTGPPISWSPQDFFVSSQDSGESGDNARHLQTQLRAELSVDGEAVYGLLPSVELFVFSKTILNHSGLKSYDDLIRWRMRVNTWHQRLLDFPAPSLQEIIFRDLVQLENRADAAFYVERALIHTLHGFDVKAREDLRLAASLHGFEYVLTGRLGKRTKFQEQELSQLVVLAKSEDSSIERSTKDPDNRVEQSKPETLDLNDDTLLENIAFAAQKSDQTNEPRVLPEEKNLSEGLRDLDPSNQPLLHPLDSTILLALASSVSATSPHDGLTREETAPYAERVLVGGSSNWQVYTQALLVRSRIEGYKSRTAERGLLQLQALVDQVIVETASSQSPVTKGDERSNGGKPTTFLPGLEDSESAPAAERLQYIHYLGSPPRWKLEAELADRWVILGGLRTALEIYERLELWAEVALCWAASGREDKAFNTIYAQLYVDENVTLDGYGSPDIGAQASSTEKSLLPNDAPRLFCILGDLTKSPAAYERAWTISGNRYARAQRSLGKIYLAKGDTEKADEAYTASLKADPQNHASWFALGCVRLQLENWSAAAESFNRALQIEDTDAESWSNLAVSLLELSNRATDRADQTKQLKSSLLALKRAASLKRDSFRIWQNLLTVAIKLVPPAYTEIVLAQSRLIELLGPTEGEKCIDIPVVEALLSDAIQQAPSSNGHGEVEAPAHGLEKMVVDLIQNKIEPIITTSRRLWQLVAKLALHQRRPHAALMSYEKAWRSQLNREGWENGVSKDSKVVWEAVVESTIDLIDGYESLGERRRETNDEAKDGTERGMVAKDWKFKARSAARSVLSKGKEVWEGSEPYERLQSRLEELKST